MGDGTAQVEPFGDNPRHPVCAALMTLGSIVQEGGRDEVWFAVATVEQPLRGARAVDDVPGVLGSEEFKQLALQVALGEGEVVRGRLDVRLAELPDPPAH